MKIYFRFDKTSVPQSVRTQVVNVTQNLISLDGEIFAFDFDPVVFTHAWQLLSSSSTRFGYDLSPYLACTCDFFLRTVPSDALCLTAGTADFKRRMSEDLSVAIASLFMVNAFGVKWHTIAQIPANNILSKTRPDFEAFDVIGDRMLYEAKGRSSLTKVIEAIENAISQVKSYPEKANYKLAFVTYFCTDERAFPSFTFMSDPQLPDTVLPDQNTAELLHLLYVLDFGGLAEAKKAYLNLLKARFSLETSKAFSFKLRNRLHQSLEVFKAAYDKEAETMEPYRYGDHLFLTRTAQIPIGERTFKITTGIHSGTRDRVLAGDTSQQVEQAEIGLDDQEEVSVFSDGTLLRVSIF